MTWTINIQGHDNLNGEQKENLEKDIVDLTRSLVHDLVLEDGNIVSFATVYTNTTGQVNLLG